MNGEPTNRTEETPIQPPEAGEAVEPPLGSEPAFPIPPTSFRDGANGLTKRELLAAMMMQGAMQGLGVHAEEFEPGEPTDAAPIARDAVRAADTLLRELAK